MALLKQQQKIVLQDPNRIMTTPSTKRVFTVDCVKIRSFSTSRPYLLSCRDKKETIFKPDHLNPEAVRIRATLCAPY